MRARQPCGIDRSQTLYWINTSFRKNIVYPFVFLFFTFFPPPFQKERKGWPVHGHKWMRAFQVKYYPWLNKHIFRHSSGVCSFCLLFHFVRATAGRLVGGSRHRYVSIFDGIDSPGIDHKWIVFLLIVLRKTKTNKKGSYMSTSFGLCTQTVW